MEVDRDVIWQEVLGMIGFVEQHLNKVGNDDLTEADYIRMAQVERRLEGIRKTYRAEEK